VKRAQGWEWASVPDYTGGLSTAVSANGILAIDRVLLPADQGALCWVYRFVLPGLWLRRF